ncbi:MAG TPA: response regulator [Methylomirabilota bacterium]|nr:response regulator [Methylomirabilota bacterium]
MKILLVEDFPAHIEWFRQHFVGHDITWTDEPLEAITYLAAGHHFDRLYLDHDLGKEPRAGRDVATWLIQHPKILPKLDIVTHTTNHVSGPKIKQELRAAGRPVRWRPFPDLVAELEPR